LKLKIIEIEISPEHYDPEKFVWKGASLEKSGESFAHEYFVSLGYKVIRGYDYDTKYERQGAPDLYVEKDGHGFFVEVKSWGDSLGLYQIKWMLEHSDHEFKLAIVPQGFFKSPDHEISIEREKS